MSHRVKSNGTVKDLAELQELDAVKTIAHAVYTAGLNAVEDHPRGCGDKHSTY